MSPGEGEEIFKGFDQVRHIPGSTYKDSSTIIIVPTRGIERHRAVDKSATPDEQKRCESGDHMRCFMDAIPKKVVQAWQALIAPMNQKRAFLYTDGHEVGKAYDAMVSNILRDPNLSKWKYILTLEDDNIPPPDAHIRLLESIEATGFDAMSGIYFTKGPIQQPMAYGDPVKYRTTGELEFIPRDINAHMQRGENVIEVNGIACGCALWRMDLFKKMPQPWFVSVSDIIPGKGSVGFTQDLYFWKLAKQNGRKAGVDLRVKVGHLDKETGKVY
jgi:hypothetical protein